VSELLDVIFNETSINISKKGEVTGEIYFRVDDTYFPQVNWNDFIVVILTWWNKAISQLESSPVGVSANFSFMDGPFNIRGKKKENGNLSLDFIRRNSNGEDVSNSIDVNILELRRLIQGVSKKVLKVIRDKKFSANEDIDELEKIISL
jgi:hypothetical protein